MLSKQSGIIENGGKSMENKPMKRRQKNRANKNGLMWFIYLFIYHFFCNQPLNKCV